MQLIPGTVVAERFRLIRQLGAGGMGAVWLAQHMGLGIPCAVKFILGEASAELRGRFEREARVAAQIRSPHVVQVLDSGLYDGTPYMAMEYLEGEDLGQRLTRMGRLNVGDTAMILGQVARALSRAHAAGLVHRDLKPENIFLIQDEDREIAKVLDFGIAKDNAATSLDGATRTGALLGTPYYMSPEQARGVRAVDHRADLWSLAIVAFQCVTGRLPFVSDALGDLLVQIIMNPIPLPSQVAHGIPQAFDLWWTRAVQRDPAHRFQSAKEFADALALASGVSLESRLGRSGSNTALLPVPSGGMPPGAVSGPGFPGENMPNPTPGYMRRAPEPDPSQGIAPGADAMAFTQPQAGAFMGAQATPQPAPLHTTAGVVASAQSLGDHPKRKGSVATAAIVGAVGLLLMMGLGAAVLLRPPKTASPTAAAVAPPPPPVAPPAPSPAVAPEPPTSAASDEPAPAASAETPASSKAPAPSASIATAPPVHVPATPHVPKPPPPPAPPGAPKGGKKDFGF